jgi:ATP-dependent exoDNAse (exonuclease V) alpha subunit
MRKDQPELVITAPPGRGKTFITKHLMKKTRDIGHMLTTIGFDKGQLAIHVTATTNKAAEVACVMLDAPVQTIHSFLGLVPRLNYQTGKEDLTKSKRFKVLKPMLVVIDEAGTVSTELLGYIREACINCKICYVGDDAQTAPVGESFCPVFEQGIPTLTLTTNHRNAGAIGNLADEMRKAVYTTAEVMRCDLAIKELVLEGMVVPNDMRKALSAAQAQVVFPDIIDNGYDIIKVDGDQFQAMVDYDYQLAGRDVNDGKIVAWRNDVVNEFNEYVRSLYTDDPYLVAGEEVITNKAITIGGIMAASADSVLAITIARTDSQEMGIDGNWLEINGKFDVFQPHDWKEVKVLLKGYYKMRDFENYHIAKELFADLRPSHACTVHKSQGSTYKTVYIDLGDIGSCYEANAVARMLNTAISRASERLVLFGELPLKYRS